jgi:hypothetical protein
MFIQPSALIVHPCASSWEGDTVAVVHSPLESPDVLQPAIPAWHQPQVPGTHANMYLFIYLSMYSFTA